MDKYVIQSVSREEIICYGRKQWRDLIVIEEGSPKSLERIEDEVDIMRKSDPTYDYQIVERKVTDTVIKEEKKPVPCPFNEFIDVPVSHCIYRVMDHYCEDGDIKINAGNSDAFCNLIVSKFEELGLTL